MLKLTKISSPIENSATLVIIPGGPGLSTSTIRTFDSLSKNFNLIYIDLPGTNENPYKKKCDFKSITNSIVKSLKPITSKLYILGHSYGGYFALSVASQLNVEAIVCIASPLSKNALALAGDNYEKYKGPNLLRLENEWNTNPTDKTFSNWLAEYGELYFFNKDLKNIVLQDKVSSELFMAIRAEDIGIELLLEKVSYMKTKKLFISGKNDKLLSEAFLKEDAKKHKFTYVSIDKASHFVHLDSPLMTSRIVNFFLTNPY